MTDTPRTDAVANEDHNSWPERHVAMYDHACYLERELAEAKKDAERLEWVMSHVSGRAWRELRVDYGDGCDRAAIDAARNKP